MKIVSFTYTKTTGDKSDRVLAVTSEPSKFVEGIDISQFSHDELAEFTVQYGNLVDEFKQKQFELLKTFDLKHNFRRFYPEQMTNVEQDYV